MKHRYIHTCFALILIAFLFLSNSGGAGLVQNTDRTGSPISNSFCAACHAGPDFEPELNIRMKKGNSFINQYMPGETYQLEISLNPRFGNPFGYGMQSVILDDANNAIGIFGTPAVGTQVTSINGIPYFEQDRVSTSNTFSIDWTAPEAGAGKANIFVGAVAVNGSGDTNGDGTVKGELTIVEMVSTNVNHDPMTINAFLVQNPVRDYIQIRLPQMQKGNIRAILFDLNGRKMFIPSFENQEVSNLKWDIRQLNSGIYFLQLKCREYFQVLKVIKR